MARETRRQTTPRSTSNKRGQEQGGPPSSSARPRPKGYPVCCSGFGSGALLVLFGTPLSGVFPNNVIEAIARAIMFPPLLSTLPVQAAILMSEVPCGAAVGLTIAVGEVYFM
ncbi:hypothetical protein EDB87DRAFT_1617505 [Lactarius vividus]|nr:hypothetical protein EDB87DRAFT_1617505 [Lactarius vividus]